VKPKSAAHQAPAASRTGNQGRDDRRDQRGWSCCSRGLPQRFGRKAQLVGAEHHHAVRGVSMERHAGGKITRERIMIAAVEIPPGRFVPAEGAQTWPISVAVSNPSPKKNSERQHVAKLWVTNRKTGPENTCNEGHDRRVIGSISSST